MNTNRGHAERIVGTVLIIRHAKRQHAIRRRLAREHATLLRRVIAIAAVITAAHGINTGAIATKWIPTTAVVIIVIIIVVIVVSRVIVAIAAIVVVAHSASSGLCGSAGRCGCGATPGGFLWPGASRRGTARAADRCGATGTPGAASRGR